MNKILVLRFKPAFRLSTRASRRRDDRSSGASRGSDPLRAFPTQHFGGEGHRKENQRKPEEILLQTISQNVEKESGLSRSHLQRVTGKQSIGRRKGAFSSGRTGILPGEP